MMERIAYRELPEGLMQSMLQLQGYVNKCGLDYALLELMRMRVSQLNGCAYCLDMHSKEALHGGESIKRLVSVSAWRDTSYYTAKEQAVLAFAERLTRMPEEFNNDLHEELQQHFTKAEIANLTLAVAVINSWNRLMISFGFEPGNYQVKEKAAVH